MPKRFDLVMGVNARAALLASRAVLPAMIAQRWGHIVNLSPPLDLAMVPGRVAYAISKLGMTLLTIGLAAEVPPARHRRQLAVAGDDRRELRQHQPPARHAGVVAEAGHPG
ncbi:MAG: SDR family NAD(P)-dependent oxidoreductase [Gemmataceae bacterium]